MHICNVNAHVYFVIYLLLYIIFTFKLLQLNALLRVASLSDHLFIFNHIMRCPAGVSSWATHFFQPLSPLKYHETFRPSVVHGVHKWKLSTNRDDLSNPIIDNWITMLATLTQPIM
jgi:hypothetical protein